MITLLVDVKTSSLDLALKPAGELSLPQAFLLCATHALIDRASPRLDQPCLVSADLAVVDVGV